MKDERLEKLSDNVRRGTPVSFNQAIEVIEYQNQIKKQKKIPFFKKVLTSFKHFLS